jgi:hypothetical protein
MSPIEISVSRRVAPSMVILMRERLLAFRNLRRDTMPGGSGKHE